MMLLCQTLFDFTALFLVARFVKECKHVLLVCFDSWLVERIDVDELSADATALLKEVNELTEIVLVKAWYADTQIRYAAIDVYKLSTEFCHVVDFVDMTAGKEIQPVKVFIVRRNDKTLI